MPRHKKGTLVRVRTEKLVGSDEHNTALHGTLWMVVSYDEDERLYHCKSIASGFRYVWFPWEITTRKEKEHEAHR